MISTDLASRLAAIAGPGAVVSDSRQLRVYRGGPWGAGDPDGRFGATPLLAVMPPDAEALAASLAEITAAGHPVVALGGGTGLTGAAMTTAETVVVDLHNLEWIQVDRESRRARVGAGVRLGGLAQTADRAGLLFAHDPWSQPLASVGGAIATNGVGYLAAGYGSMGQQVLGLQVALVDGTLIDLPSAPTSSAGPDLTRLFVGSEGTLGVITAATVRLFPRPERHVLAGYSFPDFAAGFGAIQDIVEAGIRLAMIDYEEDESSGVCQLISRVDGPREIVAATSARLSEIALRNGAEPIAESTVRSFWRGRHASANRFAQDLAAYRDRLLASLEDPPPAPSRGGWRYLHVALPAGAVLEYLANARAAAADHGMTLRSAGIWATPELLSFVLDGPRDQSETLADQLLLRAARLGGSIEYCHGVGLRLGRLLPVALGPAFPVLRRIKSALDPNALLNPGKQGM